MNVDFPFHFDTCGRTAPAADADHLRDLIEQVLFTSPGERVNRPDFGSGLMQLVFAPASEELVATVRFLTESALQQWLGHLIEVEAVDVQTRDSSLHVRVRYVERRTQERRTTELTRGVQ